MIEQTKRKPGRPRKYVGRIRTTVELSEEVLDYLDRQAQSRSDCIEQLIREKMEQEQRVS